VHLRWLTDFSLNLVGLSGTGIRPARRVPRDVAMEDILRREPVRLDNDAIADILAKRTAAVTGAGGSIGSDLCRQICQFGPSTLLLLEQAENSLFNIHRQLASEFPGIRLVPCIADICDAARIRRLFKEWRPNLVLHTAAHKHVPLMELNPGEAIKNNVFGTKTLADLADACGIEKFVMISTDKAVKPTSVMGASKRIAEIYVQSLARWSRTRFIVVRFGNVLGSVGSVIPIFKEQIARGGPVTVTHPDMERYFMTIAEACQLVLQAASMGRGGEIFMLDMGEPVKIVDLARDLIRLSGYGPQEIGITYVGVRPGEKLTEELSLPEESAGQTEHPKVFVGRPGNYDHKGISRQLAELRQLVDCTDIDQIRRHLRAIVPEYHAGDAPQAWAAPGRSNGALRSHGPAGGRAFPAARRSAAAARASSVA
jgi:FlaA1/EpsC-like NDP-sugar epimerase